MPRRICVVLNICFHLFFADAYRILTIFPIPGRSHGILGDGIVRHLLEAGHEVTYITPFVKKNPPRNLTQIDVKANEAAFNDNSLNIKEIMEKKYYVNNKNEILSLMNNISKTTLENENVQKLLRDQNQKFDVIIAEWMFSDLYSSFHAVLGCPMIWFSTIDPHWMLLRLIDEYSNAAYVPHFQDGYKLPFSITERMSTLTSPFLWTYSFNTWIHGLEMNIFNKNIVPILKQLDKPISDYNVLRYNASLILGNSHASVGGIMKLPQNYKAIAGFHIDNDVKELPLDLQKIMNESEHGVIYFSLGSNLKSKDLPTELKKNILEMLSQLKQTILWKFEENLPSLPKNVHILNWVPQQSILAHPKCIFFISHGGFMSSLEAVHFGKPFIGIPVFADQFCTVERAVQKGIAIRLDLSFTMVDDLKNAVMEMLNNPRYKEKIEELSFIYHDRPVTPGKELVHWVEHVVKTKGARYLRSPALDLPLYQKLYLDQIAVVLLVSLILTFIFNNMYYRIHFKNKTE